MSSISVTEPFIDLSSNFKDPSSPNGDLDVVNVREPQSSTISPLFSIPTTTPSPTASMESQLSPCSVKENYDPSENCCEHVSCQERAVRLSEKSHNYPKTDMTIQLNIIPIQVHDDISLKKVLHQSKPHSQGGVKRKKRCNNNKLRNKTQDSNLSVIERHKKLGDGALDKLKIDVQAFAANHTYKETARKFGIHHSTVSGWIKQSSSQTSKKPIIHERNTSYIQRNCRHHNQCFVTSTKNEADQKFTNEIMKCQCANLASENNEGKNEGTESKVCLN